MSQSNSNSISRTPDAPNNWIMTNVCCKSSAEEKNGKGNNKSVESQMTVYSSKTMKCCPFCGTSTKNDPSHMILQQPNTALPGQICN